MIRLPPLQLTSMMFDDLYRPFDLFIAAVRVCDDPPCFRRSGSGRRTEARGGRIGREEDLFTLEVRAPIEGNAAVSVVGILDECGMDESGGTESIPGGLGPAKVVKVAEDAATVEPCQRQHLIQALACVGPGAGMCWRMLEEAEVRVLAFQKSKCNETLIVRVPASVTRIPSVKGEVDGRTLR